MKRDFGKTFGGNVATKYSVLFWDAEWMPFDQMFKEELSIFELMNILEAWRVERARSVGFAIGDMSALARAAFCTVEITYG